MDLLIKVTHVFVLEQLQLVYVLLVRVGSILTAYLVNLAALRLQTAPVAIYKPLNVMRAHPHTPFHRISLVTVLPVRLRTDQHVLLRISVRQDNITIAI